MVSIADGERLSVALGTEREHPRLCFRGHLPPHLKHHPTDTNICVPSSEKAGPVTAASHSRAMRRPAAHIHRGLGSITASHT